MHRLSSLILFLLTVVLLTGCADRFPRLEVLEPLPEKLTCRIAVLPFSFQDTYPRGENIFYKAFTSELAAATNFDVVPEGDILQIYKQFKMYRKTQPSVERIQEIGRRLNAQLIVSGDILVMQEDNQGQNVQTAMTLVVRIHDSATGKFLWGTYHKRKGKEYRNVLHYGRVNSISGLARRMSDEIISLWIEEGMEQCAQ